jgi:hypothetical protein
MDADPGAVDAAAKRHARLPEVVHALVIGPPAVASPMDIHPGDAGSAPSSSGAVAGGVNAAAWRANRGHGAGGSAGAAAGPPDAAAPADSSGLSRCLDQFKSGVAGMQVRGCVRACACVWAETRASSSHAGLFVDRAAAGH